MTLVIVVAIAVSLVILGSYAARELRIGLARRAILGFALLIIGAALIYSLPGNRLEEHPVFYCLGIVMIGLGVNQIVASVLAGFRRPA